MPDQTPCQIRCTICGQWADSRIQFDTANAFFASSLVGDIVRCTWCGEMTPCTAEGMRFYVREDGESIGRFIEGKEAGRGGK